MDSARRVERLRALVARIELLPASPDRDWMLSELRTRMVDLDTGVTPRAYLPRRFPDPPPDRPPLGRSASPLGPFSSRPLPGR
jgi:hypothetical protein